MYLETHFSELPSPCCSVLGMGMEKATVEDLRNRCDIFNYFYIVSYFIIFIILYILYYYTLEVCLFSETGGRSVWEGRYREPWKFKGGINGNQDVLCEKKNLFSIKGKK